MRSVARVVAVLLAGCGWSQPPIGMPGAMPQNRAPAAPAHRSNYGVVYSFSGGSDGGHPLAGLISVNGTLYGTTEEGGPDNTTLHCYNGCGTVFSVTPDGSEKVLYAFATGRHGSYDGQYPVAGLLDVSGTLYGTTFGGGTYDRGTFFSITTSGSEHVLHSFGATSDGTYPEAPVIDVNGMLYGTTSNGGTQSSSAGTVFSITTAGAENIIYSFRGIGSRDAQSPDDAVIDVGGTLYGTTFFGGTHRHGTVFAVTMGGAENVLHSFGHNGQGAFPLSSLVELKGKLYGTTSVGGAISCGLRRGHRKLHCGVAFSMTHGGTTTVLHSFGNGSDGTGPSGGLIVVNRKIYGTTASGGAYDQGTVFSITPNGTETVLHSFGSVYDGAEPSAVMLAVNGTLYGTTVAGGAHGQGTVFSLKL